MRFSLRLLLVCLLAIALPLKALAAVTMIGCGPVHHSAAGGMPVAAAAHDDGSQAAGGGHHGSSGEHSPDKGDRADGKADNAKPHGAKMANGKCSSCAPCCAAAAPAPDSHRIAAAQPSSDVLPAATARYRGVVADVPHEPPRLRLA